MSVSSHVSASKSCPMENAWFILSWHLMTAAVSLAMAFATVPAHLLLRAAEGSGSLEPPVAHLIADAHDLQPHARRRERSGGNDVLADHRSRKKESVRRMGLEHADLDRVDIR